VGRGSLVVVNTAMKVSWEEPAVTGMTRDAHPPVHWLKYRFFESETVIV
jgi:hypothetical protein